MPQNSRGFIAETVLKAAKNRKREQDLDEAISFFKELQRSARLQTPEPGPAQLKPGAKKKFKDVLSEQLGLGKWADEMLKQADPVRKSLRSGEPESEVRKLHPDFFAQVVDAQSSEDKNRLIQQMKTRHVPNEALLDFMGKIKGNLAGDTLSDYRKKYRKHRKQKLLNKTPPRDTPKRTKRPSS